MVPWGLAREPQKLPASRLRRWSKKSATGSQRLSMIVSWRNTHTHTDTHESTIWYRHYFSSSVAHMCLYFLRIYVYIHPTYETQITSIFAQFCGVLWRFPSLVRLNFTSLASRGFRREDAHMFLTLTLDLFGEKKHVTREHLNSYFEVSFIAMLIGIRGFK